MRMRRRAFRAGSVPSAVQRGGVLLGIRLCQEISQTCRGVFRNLKPPGSRSWRAVRAPTSPRLVGGVQEEGCGEPRRAEALSLRDRRTLRGFL